MIGGCVCCSGVSAEEKKRYEARIAELEDELEEEQTNSEIFAEKARKQGLQVRDHDTRTCAKRHRGAQ